MLRWVLAIVAAAPATCIGVVGVFVLDSALTSHHGIVYDHALVVKAGAGTFETVPIDMDLPMLFIDRQGLGLVPTGHELDPTARWDGSGFRPGSAPMGRDPQLLLNSPNAAAELGAGAVLRWDYAKLTLERPGSEPVPLALPPGYQLRTVVAAGPGRAMLIPNADETRTFFVTLPDGAFEPGPAAPPYMSTIAGSAPDGTVVIVPGGDVVVRPQMTAVGIGGLATGAGGGGVITLLALGLARRLPLAGVVAGVLLGAALLALGAYGLASMLHDGLGSML